MIDNKNRFVEYNVKLVEQMNKIDKFGTEMTQMFTRVRRNIENTPNLSALIAERPALGEIHRTKDILTNNLPDYLEHHNKMLASISDSIPSNYLEHHNKVLASISDSIPSNYLEHHNKILATIPNTSFEIMVEKLNKSYPKLLNMPLARNIEEMSSLAQKIMQAIPDIESTLIDTDWESFELTEEDQGKIHTILNSNDKEGAITYELDRLQITNKINENWINFLLLATILPIVFIIVGYSIEQISLTSEKLHSKIVSSMETKELKIEMDIQKKNKPVKHIINDIIDRIKKEIPIFIQYFLGIVTKNNLIVREKNRINSKIIGTLEAQTIVQIINQKKNWIYISYLDTKENMILEGWVLTRYIKKIK